jgi:ADP-ribose pyrophosphatase YjhB (NUDIX family)
MHAGDNVEFVEPRRSGIGALHQMAGDLVIRVARVFRPQLSLGVRLLALDDDGRVFLVRHSYLPGLHMPGGAVDADETCRAAAEREAQEEGGLELAGPSELFHVYSSGGRGHVVLYVARGARQPRPARPSLEIVAARFHALDALPEGVTPATRRRLAEVLGGAPVSDDW